MAAFTPENPDDRALYRQKWTGILQDPAIRMQTVCLDDTIVGSVVHFEMMGETNVSYWIDRAHWGKGIATEALNAFIAGLPLRPLYGRTAYDNTGSQRVLEKCGFRHIATEQGFARARDGEITEFVYRLD